MVAAFFLALGQFTDPQVWRILAKSLLATLLLFLVLGAAAFMGLGWLMAWLEVDFGIPFAEILIVIVLGWMLWRILALAVLQFFADEIVAAVEARHYPAASAHARKLGWREELANSVKSAARTIAVNLLVLPLALVLLFTVFGAPLAFWLANSALLGRELTDMVWLRYRQTVGQDAPVRRWERLALGGIAAALLSVPLANLFAPFIGAAMATHLIHRKGLPAHAA